MERLPYGRYSNEFRQEAVKEVVEGGKSVHEAARGLSLAPTTLSKLVKAYKTGRLGEVGKNRRPLTEVELENYRLKKELAEIRMERDILKKRQRTLRRSRSEVRDDKGYAAQIFSVGIMQIFKSIGEWILRVA